MKIKIFGILLIIFVLSTCATSPKTPQIVPLKTVYQDHFMIGNIVNGSYLRNDYIDLLTTHFNIVTCENSMKPDHLAPRVRGGQYNWAPADNMLNEMLSYGIKVHGHTLVWHSQTHAWMYEGTPAQVRANMVNHINTVLAHYKGRVFSWDVVNEAVRNGINPGDQNRDWRTQLREDSGWFKAMGADYIELAFRTARAADPDILLYYNDYNLNNSRKATVVANMIRDINERYRAEGNDRNLIDGVGMQAHYGITTSVLNVRNTIELFISLGIKIDISELDIEVTSVGSGSFGTRKDTPISDVQARAQAIKYAELFMLFMEYSEHITRVTMWGMDDEHSWKSLGNPCLWDGELRPKQALYAVLDPRRALGL